MHIVFVTMHVYCCFRRNNTTSSVVLGVHPKQDLRVSERIVGASRPGRYAPRDFCAFHPSSVLRKLTTRSILIGVDGHRKGGSFWAHATSRITNPTGDVVSATNRITLRCDVRDCYNHQLTPRSLTSGARDWAANLGWIYRRRSDGRGVDLCPNHARQYGSLPTFAVDEPTARI